MTSSYCLFSVFQSCFSANQQNLKELLWKRKQIQISEKQQVVPFISPAEQLPSSRKVRHDTYILNFLKYS